MQNRSRNFHWCNNNTLLRFSHLSRSCTLLSNSNIFQIMNELNTVSTNSSDSTKNGGTSNSPDDMDSAAAASHAIKKRTKASRACDQCRKKKIKCDYKDEKGVCSNCQRNGDRCSFDRVPLKRGPSKGYTRSTSHPRTNEIQDHNNSRSYNTFDNSNNTLNNNTGNSGDNGINSNTCLLYTSRCV